MNTSVEYIPSGLMPGDGESARLRGFTRWMSRDLLQATTDFCKNIGLVPVYCECSSEGARCLLWHMPPGASCEVRSGRTKEKFIDFDRVNRERGWRLLSLHTSADELYSGVWISAQHYEGGSAYLRLFGISPPEVKMA